MSEQRDDQERPCLHCMIVELIDDFFAEYPANTGESDTIDTSEVITAIAKTVAELTCSQDSAIRQQLIEQLMREIMNYDAEFRRDDGTGAIGSVAPALDNFGGNQTTPLRRNPAILRPVPKEAT